MNHPNQDATTKRCSSSINKNKNIRQVINDLKIPKTLEERIHYMVEPPLLQWKDQHKDSNDTYDDDNSATTTTTNTTVHDVQQCHDEASPSFTKMTSTPSRSKTTQQNSTSYPSAAPATAATDSPTIASPFTAKKENKKNSTSSSSSSSASSFVLYLPTVTLRTQHNPALALAAHLANYYHIPLVILCTVLDDHHLILPKGQQSHQAEEVNNNTTPPTIVVGTARRLTFTLEALQICTAEWERQLGCTVLIRVHAGRSSRIPDHLTLTQRATIIIQDEPFVDPFETYCRAVERVATKVHIPCLRVDGSTLAPPVAVLQHKQHRRRQRPNHHHHNNNSPNRFKKQGQQQEEEKVDETDEEWEGVPDRAWKWKTKTEALQKRQVQGIVTLDHFATPKSLHVPTPLSSLSDDHFLWQYLPLHWRIQVSSKDINEINNNNNNGTLSPMLSSPPFQRPWTVSELLQIQPSIWSMTTSCSPEGGGCQGMMIDTTVPPCVQTHGGRGWERWQQFVSKRSSSSSSTTALQQYATKRNDIRQPHAVSRISCYLNLGTISIFQIVHDLWQLQQQQQQQQNNRTTTHSTKGLLKYQDEIFKWREMSYAHCFAHPKGTYFTSIVIPHWARSEFVVSLSTTTTVGDDGPTVPSKRTNDITTSSTTRSGGTPYSISQLVESHTNDETWNAMQTYLRDTGELHNNMRMTWGKTVVHWQKDNMALEEILYQLRVLNDRYALDGLSPPSYAGLLWCMGWCDKPTTTTSTRHGGKGGGRGGGPQRLGLSKKPTHRYRASPEDIRQAQRKLVEELPSTMELASSSSSSASIVSYFASSTTTTGSQESQSERRLGQKRTRTLESSMSTAVHGQPSIASFFTVPGKASVQNQQSHRQQENSGTKRTKTTTLNTLSSPSSSSESAPTMSTATKFPKRKGPNTLLSYFSPAKMIG